MHQQIFLIFCFLFQSMQDVLRVNTSGDLTVEWNFLEKDLPGVVLHDRFMTDAAVGHRPIKSEHSYSLNSDGDSLPDSPISSQKMDGEFRIPFFKFWFKRLEI